LNGIMLGFELKYLKPVVSYY